MFVCYFTNIITDCLRGMSNKEINVTIHIFSMENIVLFKQNIEFY